MVAFVNAKQEVNTIDMKNLTDEALLAVDKSLYKRFAYAREILQQMMSVNSMPKFLQMAPSEVENAGQIATVQNELFDLQNQNKQSFA